ncbi:amidohydrolase [Achromobacter sp. DMS1]|nr:amidohydrolase [Achromobacter sp. DMS1]
MVTLARIDTHQHIVPAAYAAWLTDNGIPGMPHPRWSPAIALELMDRQGIASAVLSVSTPGVHLGDDREARIKAREVNDYAADVVASRPDRFGFFATLTLPDVDGAIEEAVYALDVLGADGVVLMSNVGNAYLGQAAWDPLMMELNRRAAVVLVHPNELPAPELPGIPGHAADFLLNTTRAAINMARAGYMQRFPDLKIILSHAGGFLPYAAERMARQCSPDGNHEAGLANLRRFYFDTALSSSPYALACLLAFADPDKITFGSDFPHASASRVDHFTRLLDACPLDGAQREAISRGNAQALFPRLSARSERALRKGVPA